MMSLASNLDRSKFTPTGGQKAGPLWKGLEDPSPLGGVTQSLISNWLQCRERFRLRYVEGLTSEDRFSHRMEYGSLFHAAMESYAKAVRGRDYRSQEERVRHSLCAVTKYAQQLCRRHYTSQDQINHWQRVCKVQFPLYVNYWAKHDKETEVKHLLAEQPFNVVYTLPSGRTVYLRGKWDGVDLIGSGGDAGIWLFESKTKGEIREQQIQRQLLWDLQTMLYIIALRLEWDSSSNWYGQDTRKVKVIGVRYNVIRRPLSGGTGSITRHKATQGSKCSKCDGQRITLFNGGEISCPKCEGKGRVGGKPEETQDHFYGRVRDIIAESPDTFFMRWKVDVKPHDIEKFRERCLDPILEAICDWYQWVTKGHQNPFSPGGIHTTGKAGASLHWVHPFNVWNQLDEGGSTEYDEYLSSGSEVGLVRATTLFPELQEEQP
jgi:hypothetical protein